MTARRLYVLDLGVIGTDKASFTGVIPATEDDREKVSEWIQIPSLAFLVDHPDAGWILFDTGCHPDGMGGHWPRGLRRHAPHIAAQSQSLLMQLEIVGLTPDDLDWVVVSHLHFDHAGNIGLFSGTRAGTRVVVHREELAEALVKTHEGFRRYAAGYVAADFVHDGIGYHLIEGDHELASGVELVTLPGHTPGMLGMTVHLADEEIFLPSDAVYTDWNLHNPDRIPATCFDSIGYRRTIRRIRSWVDRPGRSILYSHDPDASRTYRFAPDHY